MRGNDLLPHRCSKFLLRSIMIVAALAIIVAAGIKITAKATLTNSAISIGCLATGSNATFRVSVIGVATDGSRDDSAPIQDAIDAAGRHGGGIVTLPAGTFMINSHLVLRNNVKLIGAGPATVIKAGPEFLSSQGPGGGYPIISTAGASNTTISDLTADQSGNTLNADDAVRLTGYVVEGRNSNNLVVDGVYVRHPFTYSIAMVGSTDFCVERCNTLATTSNRYSQLDGIHILDSSSGRVIDNQVQSGDDGLVAHTIGAPVHNVVYADNKVHGGLTDAGMQLAVGDFPIYDIKIVNNSFVGSLFGIHMRYYDGRTGSVSNITITNNLIYNLAQGKRSFAINMVGASGLGAIKNITISGNRLCNAGPISVRRGFGNTVAGTTVCGVR